MPDFAMENHDWERLLSRIDEGLVTPFLGAGACVPAIPSGATIAERLAGVDYPLDDKTDLIRVSQYLRVLNNDRTYPKEKLVREFLRNINYPDFQSKNEPHSILADLPLPIYVTTNYDDFMVRALRSRNRIARREFCRWNEDLYQINPLADLPDPTPDKPLVFHLHGYDQSPETMVLTEDDYIEFLVNIGKRDVLPVKIREVLVRHSLLFIGYSLRDLNFRVLFQGLKSTMGGRMNRGSFTLQLPNNEPAQKKYVEDYFGVMDIKVVWGDAQVFAAELRRRWENYKR